MAKPIIAQCRREIELGWQHLEAARIVLQRSRWLVARWKDSDKLSAEIPLAPQQEMFIPVNPDAINVLRQRKRRSTRSRRVSAAS